jgi:hypothetical protein
MRVVCAFNPSVDVWRCRDRALPESSNQVRSPAIEWASTAAMREYLSFKNCVFIDLTPRPPSRFQGKRRAASVRTFDVVLLTCMLSIEQPLCGDRWCSPA